VFPLAFSIAAVDDLRQGVHTLFVHCFSVEVSLDLVFQRHLKVLRGAVVVVCGNGALSAGVVLFYDLDAEVGYVLILSLVEVTICKKKFITTGHYVLGTLLVHITTPYAIILGSQGFLEIRYWKVTEEVLPIDRVDELGITVRVVDNIRCAHTAADPLCHAGRGVCTKSHEGSVSYVRT
jgi:hypothetical protein